MEQNSIEQSRQNSTSLSKHFLQRRVKQDNQAARVSTAAGLVSPVYLQVTEIRINKTRPSFDQIQSPTTLVNPPHRAALFSVSFFGLAWICDEPAIDGPLIVSYSCRCPRCYPSLTETTTGERHARRESRQPARSPGRSPLARARCTGRHQRLPAAARTGCSGR